MIGECWANVVFGDDILDICYWLEEVPMDTAADIVTQLAARPHEEEWFEFKTNWCEPRILGEYVSALSNAVLSRPNPHRS